ncbi:MAG: bifunctional (p)ppGpp synthetase/guanosine-3',5'-bis(diphosphate) 3'-pyrophosphohydrolase [Pseudomonadota bacterium]|nr:bifunctional (p)ppGpp synthetase/guanosine-3',5'-bis(diphosphate) 3'-pyrophosphohydrolase [Pseudomonadota bacterium]MDP1903475.1 bifunctional (p)ppGpp synthetase/guanosine-3',5'-bis(diphosphate) 3'-pyrophosphohydrolase [Pseudomonadota bacterium]MDP2351568.1 bifunctional (p)ppGpp synthetase/guanosine-3',5'-bis(diphosphate) 3'-pyrophosphohydrolase [Pseudomonadota bacterium]
MVAHALTFASNDAESWLASLAPVYSESQREGLRRALNWLADHSAGVRADTGADLAEHSLGTAAILAGMRFDADTVTAALLCGLPDAALAKDVLIKTFGAPLTLLVEGAAKLTRMDRLLTELAAEGGQSEALRQMLLAMTDDIRVVLIKLAERTQALRELASQDEPLRRKIAGDVRELYAPLANRLGVWQLKWELEDLSCRYLEPDTYRQIAKSLDERRLDREWYIEQVIKQLADALEADGISGFTVNGRPKHISSILAKMRKKRLSFDEVYDVRALRVQMRDVKDCFHALGLVHSLWQPIPGQFDDYISRPKGNGYKSLHTAVVGPENKALEVQLRTFDMHQEAELGVAAHWRYKEGGKSQGDAIQDKIAWLRQILAWKQEIGEGEDQGEGHELAQHFRNELFQDEVFVLTPQGKVVALTAGATPLDFAYAVHTELGHRCRGAKLDGSLVPLDTALKTGQRVEILTVKQGGPSRDWLNPHLGVLKSTRARAKVRQWFKQQDHDTHVQEGRALLDRELHRLNLNNVNLDKLAARLKFPSLDELCAALGRGDLGSGTLDRALHEEFIPAPEKPLVSASKRRADAGGVLVEGEPGLLTQMAGCCKPVPHDPIIGYITQGHGITIHRADCPMVRHLPEDKQARLLAADWGDQDSEVFAVDVELTARDRSGLLKDVGELFSQEKINVVRVNTLSQDDMARMEFTLEVRDISQLTRFLARVGQVRGVHSARRK